MIDSRTELISELKTRDFNPYTLPTTNHRPKKTRAEAQIIIINSLWETN